MRQVNIFPSWVVLTRNNVKNGSPPKFRKNSRNVCYF